MRDTWVEVNLTNLEHNINENKRFLKPDTMMIAVIKANAYGHGSVEVAKCMQENGIHHFAVATVSEAQRLREGGIADDVLILGYIPKGCEEYVAEQGITTVVGDYGMAERLSKAALAVGRTAKCFAAVDTGMSRIGFAVRTDEERRFAAEEIARITELPGIDLVGMTSHFADADSDTREYTDMQLDNFRAMLDEIERAGVELRIRMIANSAAITEYPEAEYDAVRPGTTFYGVPVSEFSCKDMDLWPVMSIRANMTCLKTIPAGTRVSYNGIWTAERESRIATVSIGYADGYSRLFAGKADVLVRGRRCPVVGNICMDQIMIDVTDVPEVTMDDIVTVMGRDGDEEITSDELAGFIGTINCEFLCLFDVRLPKVYVR